MTDVYSYHTFILPFIWEGSEMSMDSFAGFFDNNPNWQDISISDENALPNLNARNDGMTELLFYKEFQYFHPYVRRAIYGSESSIVRNYAFMPANINNKAKYYIEKTKHVSSLNTDITRKYMLTVNGIKLKIFNTGVALFILECENRGVDAEGKSQASIEDVKNINDYGRRISLPYFPTESAAYSACADRLCLEIPNVSSFEDNYTLLINDLLKGKKTTNNDISMTHMCDWIKEILGYGSMYRFSSRKNHDKRSVYIYPALDDRMFVACCVCEDAQVVNAMKAEVKGDYAFLSDEEQSLSLYELAFIDPGRFEGEARNCTCISPKMRRVLLEEHVYDRWVHLGEPNNPSDTNYGTIYTVANQGLVLLMNDAIEHIIESFLTQYIQMCCLVLVQRASLIHFQREASSLSAHIEEPGKKLSKKTITKLMNLQERFVAYQSQLSFNEVTPQEQGIEIYSLLRKFMFIEEETTAFNERLTVLEDASTTNLDFGFNRIALIFTYVSCILAIFQNVFCLYDDRSFSGWATKPVLIISTLTFLAVLISVTAVVLRYRRRKR